MNTTAIAYEKTVGRNLKSFGAPMLVLLYYDSTIKGVALNRGSIALTVTCWGSF